MIVNHPEILSSNDLNIVESTKDNIPSFIGFFIADKEGKALLSFEIFKNALEFYLKKHVSDESDDNFNLDLIPMSNSTLEIFSEQMNFRELSGLNLLGTGLKMRSFFCFKQFTVTFLMNLRITVKYFEKPIKEFLKKFFKENEDIFQDFYAKCSTEDLTHMQLTGSLWLNKMNKLLQLRV